MFAVLYHVRSHILFIFCSTECITLFIYVFVYVCVCVGVFHEHVCVMYNYISEDTFGQTTKKIHENNGPQSLL